MLNSHAVRAIKNRRSIIFHDTMYAKDASIPDMHQKRILIDTIKNPAKGMFLGGPSFAEAKEILMKKFGYTEQAIKNLAKDSDPRGYKVTDQIIKGFMIYKSGKPNVFTAKNESGEQYEGTMEQVKKQIDDYWVKRDEDVMKQKVNDAIKIVSYKGYEIIKNDNDDKFRVFLSGFEVFVPQKSLEAAKALIDKKNSKAKDSKTTKDRMPHPRFRIKDDKLFRLRAAIKKTKDAEFSKKLAISFQDAAEEYLDIYKGFYIDYNKNLNRYEGRGEISYVASSWNELKKLIDAYWAKRDEDVMKQKVNDELTLSEAIKIAKRELYPDKDYSTLNATEHDNVTIRARELMRTKTKDKVYFVNATVEQNGQKKKLNKPMNANSDEEAKESFKKFILAQFPSTKILEMTIDAKTKDKYGDKIAYKGYLIGEYLNGKFWIEKDGFVIRHEAPSIEDAKKDINMLTADSKTKDDIFYQGQQYPAKELHRILVNKGKVKSFNALSDKEQKEREDNPFALYEAGDDIYAVVRRNRVN